MNLFKKAKEKLSCIHGHSIDDHPKCFAEGEIIDKRADKLKPWYEEEGCKIGVLDIEATGLKADFSTMLSYAIKDKNGTVYTNHILKSELFDGVFDQLLVESLVKKLSEYKIIIGYYSNGYDIPYVRAKALHYGIEFPGYKLVETKRGGTKYVPSLYSWDLYPVVKYKLNLSRNSLDNACDYLGIKGKTPLDKEVWRKAAYGDREAILKVVEHNIADVEITDQLHTKLCAFNRWGRTSI